MSGVVVDPHSAPPDAGRWPKWWLPIAGLTALLVVGGTVLTVRHFSAGSAPVVVESPPALKTVSALGRLEPAGEIIQVAAPAGTAGTRLEQLRVKLGDLVTAGKVLAVLDIQAKYQAAVAQAQSRVRMSQAKLAKVKSGAKSGAIRAQTSQIEQFRIERADQMMAQQAKIQRLRANLKGEVAAQQATVDRRAAEYRNAKVDRARFDQLYNSGGISASQRDSAKLKVDTAWQQWQEAIAMLEKQRTARQAEIVEAQAMLNRIRAGQAQQIKQARANLDRIAEVRPADVQIAQAEVAEAQANLRQAQATLATAYVRAPQSGQVLKIHTRAGETIRSMGDTLGVLDLGQTQQMVAVAEVYDSDVGKIQSGQTATVRATSIGEKLQGRVTEVGYKVQRQNVVNTDPTSNIDARIVEVRVQLDAGSSQKVAKLTNLQVEVSIDLDQDVAR
ncbi:HlyD family efflux transporter periplasmic adaptor subunit [filamentous cyanobacterium LEGE 11480]|uniref:HlyD family efflux transporter periplasmic adaptor subunit n=1 Tax=Romeriopsis navalis LEGE 11480 TaxID=2777977 RepID=A0A928Z2K8_9CYAN|nr:HlyD family efflux transporter periplasmic adaptor subunit [Romeriopsis navalis]MBE9028233.1 HlyD family efflux transporter periplasmic adaptor subunit [Romeriopsis navalis LEGE 11480]